MSASGHHLFEKLVQKCTGFFIAYKKVKHSIELVRFIKAIPGFAPPSGLRPCKSDPVRFVRLWAPLISTKSLAIAGLFVICNMTTATRVGELGAPFDSSKPTNRTVT